MGSLFCFSEAINTSCSSLSGRTLVQVNIQLPQVQPSLGLDLYLQERPIPTGTCQPHHCRLFLKEANTGPSPSYTPRV